jgi:hypothetical protein
VGSGVPCGGCAAVALPLSGVFAVVVVLSGCLLCAGVSAGADIMKKKKEGKGGKGREG